MTATFERRKRSLSTDDLASFKALCLLRAESLTAPYSALVSAPQIQNALTAQALVQRAYQEAAHDIESLYETKSGSGAELFARVLGEVLQAPGRVPTLISTDVFEYLDWFEVNVAKELGGALDSTFTGTFSCGLTQDTYHSIDNAFGDGRSVSFSVDYLTEEGVEFAHWLLGAEIEEMRARERANSAKG